MSFAICLLWAGLLGASLTAHAQTTPLLTHPIRSITPTDTSFADLEFLQQEIGAARVVMLGEPTHGEGNVTEAKIRLLRFLKERMGFTTAAFESGFYELDKAQRAIQAGTPAREAVGSSVFPVWTSTREFQALLPLLGPGKTRLRVAGFDSQLSGEYQDELLEELEAFLKPEKGAAGIGYDYLDDCLSMMGESFIFPPAQSVALFDLQLGKARRLLEKVAAGPDARRRERAAFWLQNLRSLQALAHDYATNDPSAKSRAEFKATDSNPRDAQMADNLLWYLRQHPQEKVVCWGALPHLANKVEVLGDAEIKTYRPMGRAVKAALGADAVYVLGTLAGGGTHGFGATAEAVPVPAAGSLEAALLPGPEYAFVSLKHDAPGQVLTTYAFEYKPQSGPWSEVVDGFLYLKSVNPPHGAALAGEAMGPGESPAAAPAPGPLNPAPALRRTVSGGKTAGSVPGSTVRGRVLDRRTGQPVAFATVAVPGRGTATVADEQGRFALVLKAEEALQVTSLGYEAAQLTAVGGIVTVRLLPAAYALGNVHVSAATQNPKTILKKVIQALPRNYDLGEQTAQVYDHRWASNFDTVRYDGECVMNVLVPAGYRKFISFLNTGPRPEIRVQEAHHAVGRPNSVVRDVYVGQGMNTISADPVRIAPLFLLRNLGKFNLRLDSVLQQGTETMYVVSFRARKASRRTTGTYLQAGYQGQLFIQQRDYAVTRYEALWQHDTVRYNAVAHKYFGKKNLTSRLYNSVYSDWRSTHQALYAPGADGRYRLVSTQGQALLIGRHLEKGPFHYQSSCALHYQPLPAEATPPTPTAGSPSESAQAQLVPYRPEFWETYQRPVAREAAPAVLPVTKP